MTKYLVSNKYHTKNIRKNKTRRNLKRNKTRRNIRKNKLKRVAGKLEELDKLDIRKKTIILMGELHTSKTDNAEYLNIIKKQKNIIDNVVKKIGENKTYFYSEAPIGLIDKVLRTDNYSSSNYSSSVIVQYVNFRTNIPIKYSSISLCDRETGSCNNEYSDDILSIFAINPEIKCIIVAIGLLHVPELKRLINEKQSDINIIIINTVSQEQLKPFIPHFFSNKSMRELLYTEPSYKLPIETFKVSVLINKDGKKIYKCPLCEAITGTAAPENPEDTDLFTHNFTCPNKGKIPVELSEITFK